VKKRDELKKALVREGGITLIEVPCWWDYRLERYFIPSSPSHPTHTHTHTQNSLAATIKKHRPDLAHKMIPVREDASLPIPESPPPDFFSKPAEYIEGAGVPTNACFLEKSRIDPTNW